MSIVRLLAAAAAMLALAACSSTSTNKVSSTSPHGVNQSSADMVQVGGTGEEDDVGLKCKRVQVTGTRFSEKVCTTKRQREERARAAAEAQREIGIKAQQMGGPSSS